MEWLTGGAHSIFVEDLLYGGEPLAFVADFLGSREHGWHVHAKHLRGEGLELLAKYNRVRPACPHEFHFLRRERRRNVDQLFAVLVEFLGLGVDGQHGAGLHRVGLLQHGFSLSVHDHIAVGVRLFDPVLQVHPDAAGHAHGGQENGGDAVGAGHHGGDVDERHERAGLLADPKGDVVHPRHPGRSHAHGAFFSHKHDTLAWVLLLQIQQFLLTRAVVLKHGLAVQLAVRTRVRVGSRRQQVGGDVADPCDVGHHVDGLLDVGQLGEEFSLGVALDDAFGHGIAGLVRRFKTLGVRLVQEHLCFQDVASLCSDVPILSQGQIQQHFHRWATLHVRELLERRSTGDFRHRCVSKDDGLQESGFDACGACGAGKDVVHEEMERRLPVGVAGVLDLVNDLGQQRRVVDGFGVEAFALSVFNLLEIC